MKQELLFVEDLSKVKPFWNDLNDFTHTCIDIGQFTRNKRYNKTYNKIPTDLTEPKIRITTGKNKSHTDIIDNYYSKEDFVFYHNSKKVTPIIKEKEFIIDVEIGLYQNMYIRTKDIIDNSFEDDLIDSFEYITYNIINQNIKNFYILNAGDLLFVELENDFKYYLQEIQSRIDKKKEESQTIDLADESIKASAKITKISFYCPECNTRMFCKKNTCKEVARVLTSATIFDDEDKISLSLTFLEKDVRFKVVWMKSYRKNLYSTKKL